ncbi:BnaC06g42640D [Brassica napus]|uniref:BnaC06g42640D protein n=1 Tax=Brassica napus TaxID=3708 RepID=A0A078JEW4_BRANA|nr:BnaC06g42640D [Brassica napus]
MFIPRILTYLLICSRFYLFLFERYIKKNDVRWQIKANTSLAQLLITRAVSISSHTATCHSQS